MEPKSVTASTVYFHRPGKENTEDTLNLALKRAEELGIKTILVATTGGDTGVRAMSLFKGYKVIVVTHCYGLHNPDEQEFDPEKKAAIEAAGGIILTTTHAFGGVSRAARTKFNTYQTSELMANTLKIFGEGTKVVCEMAMMAADSGLVKTTEEIIAIAGTGRGADTAAVLKPAHAHNFFDLRVKEIICKPRF
jgi:hypothetical protein